MERMSAKESRPSVNKKTLERLGGKKLFAESPFCFALEHKRKGTSHEEVRHQCEIIVEDYRSHIMDKAYPLAPGEQHPTPREVKRAVSEIKEDHDLAYRILKKSHEKEQFEEGAVIDTISGGLGTIEFSDGRKIKIRPKVINPKFRFKHLFAVIDGKIAPLVEFPEE